MENKTIYKSYIDIWALIYWSQLSLQVTSEVTRVLSAYFLADSSLEFKVLFIPISSGLQYSKWGSR